GSIPGSPFKAQRPGGRDRDRSLSTVLLKHSQYPISLRKNEMMAMAAAIYLCCPTGGGDDIVFGIEAVPLLARAPSGVCSLVNISAAPARSRILARAAPWKAPSKLRPSIQRFDEK